jgi:hypothetical protein
MFWDVLVRSYLRLIALLFGDILAIFSAALNNHVQVYPVADCAGLILQMTIL